MSQTLDHASLGPAVATLLDEGQNADRAGRREMARRRYEGALYLLRVERPDAAATIMRRIARTYLDEGALDVAVDCLTAALGVSEAANDLSGVAHALNFLAVTSSQRGEFDQAESYAERALHFAREAADLPLQAIIDQNLGVSASMRGDFTLALIHFEACLSSLRAADMREYMGDALNNMGLVYTQLGRLDEAHSSYDEAVTFYAAAGETPRRLLTLINSAELWIARREYDRAVAVCVNVLVEADATGDQRANGEANRHLGVVARVRGELEESERRLYSAYDNAMQREDLLLAAETAREQASLYELMGKNRETLQSLLRSHKLFTKLRAQHNLADLQRRVARLENSFYELVGRWAQSIESKDAYTLGHCERVADYACALARDVGFDDITLFWFRIGALLHDVGKIAVPSEILNKPGRLTPEEREAMELHAAAGANMLGDIDFPWDVIPMVRGHHERWDGTGYPDRLAGEDIHLSARITCIADVFDALTTDRPYRAGFTREQALAMMAADSGKLFDPELFARFERVVRTMDRLYVIPTPNRSRAVAAVAG
ncbi:MAG TPA: HD domain-containing phosphohydrolase [Gemmatimonadaceae bacterium]|nr:HD domain-containing phosphohydrolase [Gemmatimonadaceae bacterium]